MQLFLLSIHDSEVDPHLMSFFLPSLMKSGFICMDIFPPKIVLTGVNSEKQYLMHKIPLHDVNSWCVVHVECLTNYHIYIID